MAFSRDASHVLSSSYDGLARVHGLKSGKMLKEFRGHTSYVNQAIYSQDSNQVHVLPRQLLKGSPGMIALHSNAKDPSLCSC